MQLYFAANPQKPAALETEKRLWAAAEESGFVCSQLPEGNGQADKKGILVVIGGDGSIIRQAQAALRLKLPILGVHCGRVGFLTETTEEAFPGALERLLSGDYRLEERAMLSCRVNDSETYLCLNDAILYKRSFSGVIDIAVSIDGEEALEVSGDGVVVSTPTGSTGYSLSAGGPIVFSGLGAMVITPICPHNLHARPMVLPMSSAVELTAKGSGAAAMDGQRVSAIEAGQSIRVTGSRKKVSFIRFDRTNLYRRIQERLT